MVSYLLLLNFPSELFILFIISCDELQMDLTKGFASSGCLCCSLNFLITSIVAMYPGASFWMGAASFLC